MSLAIFGGTVVDVIFPCVVKLPAWPQHTEFTARNLVLLDRGPIVTLGGNGANAAYVATASGAKVTLHTQVGTDALGECARGWLEGAGCRVVSGRANDTAVNVTAANRQLQRATLFYPGKKIQLPRLSPLGDATKRHVLVCGWPHPPLSELARFFAHSRRQGDFTALDAGPILTKSWSISALRPVLASLDLFLANDYELGRITRCTELGAALTRLRRDFAGHIVIKRGVQGAAWLPAGENAKGVQIFPRKKVTVLNTVGAGDSFNGALLAALTRRLKFPAALRAATRTAASVVASPRGILGVRRRGMRTPQNRRSTRAYDEPS